MMPRIAAPAKGYGRPIRRTCAHCQRDVGFLKDDCCLNCYAQERKTMTATPDSTTRTPEAQAAAPGPTLAKPGSTKGKSYASDERFTAVVQSADSPAAAAAVLNVNPSSVLARIKRLHLTPPWSRGATGKAPAKASTPKPAPKPVVHSAAKPAAPIPPLVELISPLPYNLGRAIELLTQAHAAPAAAVVENLRAAQLLIGREIRRRTEARA